MIVYRFERNGIGPYVGGTKVVPVGLYGSSKVKTKTKLKAEALYIKKINQVSFDDELRKRWRKAHQKKRYLFGCSSKENLRIYFGGSFKELFKQGYRIKRYKVPDNKIIDLGIEVAFPVRYHKLQHIKKIRETLRGI